MSVPDLRDDDALLAEQPGHAGPAFAVFYARHERAVLAYFRRRVPASETAADLAAETFAQAGLRCGSSIRASTVCAPPISPRVTNGS